MHSWLLWWGVAGWTCAAAGWWCAWRAEREAQYWVAQAMQARERAITTSADATGPAAHGIQAEADAIVSERWRE